MIRNKIGILATALAVFFGAQAAFADQLVTNGGFETGDFTGWTLTGPATTSAAASDFYGVDSGDAASGNFGAYLGSDFSKLTLAQNLTVVPGKSYTVSFALAQDSAVIAGFTNSFLVTLAGQTLFSETNAPVSPFTNYSFTLTIPTAGTTSAPLDFISEDDLGYFSLDNVSVSTNASAGSAVPEPATFLLFGSAMAALGLMRRRRP